MSLLCLNSLLSVQIHSFVGYQPFLSCFCCSLSHIWFFATQWTAARQASLSFTISWSLVKLMSIHSSHPLSPASPLALNLVTSKIILSILQFNFAVPEFFNYILIFTLLITLNPLLILGQLVNSHFFNNFLCAISSVVFFWNYNMIEIRTAHHNLSSMTFLSSTPPAFLFVVILHAAFWVNVSFNSLIFSSAKLLHHLVFDYEGCITPFQHF